MKAVSSHFVLLLALFGFSSLLPAELVETSDEVQVTSSALGEGYSRDRLKVHGNERNFSISGYLERYAQDYFSSTLTVNNIPEKWMPP